MKFAQVLTLVEDILQESGPGDYIMAMTPLKDVIQIKGERMLDVLRWAVANGGATTAGIPRQELNKKYSIQNCRTPAEWDQNPGYDIFKYDQKSAAGAGILRYFTTTEVKSNRNVRNVRVLPWVVEALKANPHNKNDSQPPPSMLNS